jgi:hypothetical protein
MHDKLKGRRHKEWINLGGQLVQKVDLDRLRNDIGSGKLNSWKNIHDRYHNLWKKYILDKQKHAYAVLCELNDTEKISVIQWQKALDKAIQIQEYISEQVFITRKKDYENPFKKTTFRNPEEMNAVLGTIEENNFINQTRRESEKFIKILKSIKAVK